MGVYNTELFSNLGLCCFYAQQYDMSLSCFERALSLASDDENTADVWYNIGCVAVVSDTLHLAIRICISKDHLARYVLTQQFRLSKQVSATGLNTVLMANVQS